MRPGWLAQAAFVFFPFLAHRVSPPHSAHVILSEAETHEVKSPRSRRTPTFFSVAGTLAKNLKRSRVRHPSVHFGCPILPRSLRKGGIPRSRPSWDLADTVRA